MRIVNIAYSQSKETIYGYGLKRWDKASVEISLDENEQPDKAFELAKKLVNEQLDITINQIDPENKPLQVDKPKVADEIQAVLDGIRASKDMKELGSWWLKSKGNLSLSGAYKMQENLINQNVK